MVRKERYIGLGIDRDTAPDKRKTDTYWDAENICIMNNGRSLSIKPIKGETITNQIFADKLIGPTVYYQRYIVGYVVFMENIYVFTTTDPSTTTPRALIPTTAFTDIDNIYKIDSTGTITQLAESRFSFCVGNRIDAIANYETEDIIKLYWVDGYNMLRYYDVIGTILGRASQVGVVDVVTLATPTVVLETGGDLIAGTIQYCYNFYYQHGSQSNMSPLSSLLSISRYFVGGISQQNMSLKTKIILSNLDTVYDAIKVYSIHYQELNQSPKVSLIYDSFLQNRTSITLYDDGNSQITELSLSDILAITISPIIPNTLAIKRDRLFVANYESTNFNPTIDVRAYSYAFGITTGTYLKDDGGSVSYTNTELNNLYPLHNSINPDYAIYMYKIDGSTKGGTGLNVAYGFVTSAMANYPTGIVPPKSLKQEEIYRIGITFYNQYGQTSPVKWIADTKIPFISGTTQYVTGITINLTSAGVTACTNLGITGYQLCIVERTPQNRTIIAQGFIVPSVKYYDGSGGINPLSPYYFPYYIGKDIISSTSDATLGGNIEYSYTQDIDYQHTGTTGSQPIMQEEVVFFYSSDTIFDVDISLPTKIKFLGMGLCTNAANSGARAIKRYTDDKLIHWIELAQYATNWSGYAYGEPHHILDQTESPTGAGVIVVNEITTNKKYGSVSKWDSSSRPADYDVNAVINLREGEIKILHTNSTVSNYVNFPDLILDDPAGSDYVPTSYLAKFCSCIALRFITTSWHRLSYPTGYRFDKFDCGASGQIRNNYYGSTARGIPMVELLQTVPNQYGGNTYEDKQRNEYLKLGNLRSINNTINDEYIGDIWIGTLSVNRSDGTDDKSDGIQNIYEYIHISDVENNHNVYARNDKLNDWGSYLNITHNYNLYRIEDNHKLLGAYNQIPNVFKGYAEPYNSNIVNKFPLSILGSNAKNINEILDTWLVFNSFDTKLMEGQYGPITKLHNLSGELIAIQSTGIAALAIEPRIQTTGSDGFQVSLGIGTLFYDHRYLTTTTGSNTKFSIVDDGKTLYYYDTLQNTINTLHEGKLSTLKTVKGLLDLYTTGPHTTTFFNKLDQVYFQYTEFTLVYDILLQKFISRHLLLNSNKWLIPNAGVLYQIDETLTNTTLCTQFTGTTKNTKLIYLMCPDSTYEKVFHNLEYRLIGSNFTNVKVTNERSDSSTIASDIKTKFDIHRLHLPRVQNSRERFRGIYVFVELNNTSGIDYSLDDMVLMYNIKG